MCMCTHMYLAIHMQGRSAAAEFHECTFVENVVTVNVYGGGAVRLKQNCKPRFINCAFIGNDGGAEVR